MPDLITWRQGRCLPYGDGVSYWALGEMVKAEAGHPRDGHRRRGRGASSIGCVAELIPEEDERAWVARHLRPLIGLRAGARGRARRDRRRARRPGGASSNPSPSGGRPC